MATYAIGDVQGCAEPLERLLEALAFDPHTDRLWFCGDLINRGPHSLTTLRRLRDLGPAAQVVLGNHDLTLLAVAEGFVKPRRKDTFDQILEASDRDELLAWMRLQPLIHHEQSLGFTMVHAGLPPQWDLALALKCGNEVQAMLRAAHYRDFLAEMFGNKPGKWDRKLRGIERLRFICNAFTRLRFCTAKGELSFTEKGPPGTQGKDLMPWYQVPGRRSAGLEIVFGHWAALGCYVGDRVYGLDSGCVWGGRLTAMRLDGDQRGTLISVPCTG